MSFYGKFSVGNFNLLQNYHDFEWCKPKHSEEELFEMLVLEIMQAGLSWQIILKKRDYLKQAFNNFEIESVANFNKENIKNLMQNENIIRNKKKILSIINNAQQILKIKKIFGSFNEYIWSFTKGLTIDHKLKLNDVLPSKNELSTKISKNLKKLGFKFCGPVVIYSYLQAVGIVNDHQIHCQFR